MQEDNISCPWNQETNCLYSSNCLYSNRAAEFSSLAQLKGFNFSLVLVEKNSCIHTDNCGMWWEAEKNRRS